MLFTGKARYPDMKAGYDRYCGKRRPEDRRLGMAEFSRAVKAYCKEMAAELERTGMVDLPCGLGTIWAVEITRKPAYDPVAGKYRSADVIDWNETRRTGEIVRKDGRKTFGFTFAPRRGKGMENFRCWGIQANKALYRRMRKRYDGGTLGFPLAQLENFVI